MYKYRIIKEKAYNNYYRAQKRFLLFFWVNLTSIDKSLDWCEYVISKRMLEDEIKKNNPKNIIIKEYK